MPRSNVDGFGGACASTPSGKLQGLSRQHHMAMELMVIRVGPLYAPFSISSFVCDSIRLGGFRLVGFCATGCVENGAL